MYGRYLLCVQCGHYLTDREVARLWDFRSMRDEADLSRQLEPVPSVLARR